MLKLVETFDMALRRTGLEADCGGLKPASTGSTGGLARSRFSIPISWLVLALALAFAQLATARDTGQVSKVPSAAATSRIAPAGRPGKGPGPTVRVLCPSGPAVAVEGQRRLALLIGVGDYRSPKVSDLKGPPNDARSMYDLLTGPGGFGFPRENVCLLLDSAATQRSVREMFEHSLVQRAKADDVVLIFFAGHGSQEADANRDEVDGLDETLLLHDSGDGADSGLLDDELETMLERLHHRTPNITVILDACHSGSATRNPVDLSLIHI